jgi:hypothetical protein
MSTSRRPARPTFLRNAFALEARGTRAATFQDKRVPRGGDQNWQRCWLDEAGDEPEQAPVSVRFFSPPA